MVSIRFHAFAQIHPFCFVKASRRLLTRGWLLFWRMIFSAKAILFDMDGVLMDSTPSVERVWRKWAANHGLDPERVASLAHGRRSIETIQHVAPELDAAKENVVVEQMEIDDKEGVTALPGAAELLAHLPPDRFAIVTSATRPLAVARLGYAGLPVPRHMVTADDVIHGKPSPEPFLKGAALLGFDPADCLVFEDSPAGISSARSAGIKIIALQTTYPVDQLHDADAIIRSLADVKASLRDRNIRLELAPFPIAKDEVS
jgi:sugar-phosphatase